MKLETSLNFIYSCCANRINKKIKASDSALDKIYSSDPKILSSIRHNKRTSRNRFLVPDRVFYNPQYEDGLLVKLDFHKSKQEVLWGTDEEIKENLPHIFKKIMLDLLDNQSELDFSIEDILCDFVPYAKYSTYFNLLFSKDNSFPALSYGVYEDNIIENIDISRKNAIKFLYQKCEKDFSETFIKFTQETKSFKKIDKVFNNNFINKLFIPLLKKYIPEENSLGIRVKNLITADLSHVPKLIFPKESNKKYYQKLICASSEYILKLEQIQKNIISIN